MLLLFYLSLLLLLLLLFDKTVNWPYIDKDILWKQHLSAQTSKTFTDHCECLLRIIHWAAVWRNNQSTDSTGGWLPLSVGWKSGPERGFITVSLTLNFLKQIMQTLIIRCVLWRLIWVCIVCQCSNPGFTDNPLYTLHPEITAIRIAAINNCYLDFV